MNYAVIWTPEAEESFNQNIAYLLQEWNHQVLADFIDRVDEVIEKIKHEPEIFPLHKKSRHIHRAIVTSQITLSFRPLRVSRQGTRSL